MELWWISTNQSSFRIIFLAGLCTSLILGCSVFSGFTKVLDFLM